MTLAPKSKPANTIHHKKRSGAHHRQSKHYARPYWPYLPLVLIVGFGLVLNTAWSGRAHDVLGDSTAIGASGLLVDTNAQRTADHEALLHLNTKLSQAAQAKANDMAARNYWSHNTPEGKMPWTFIVATGYEYRVAGENLAYGFSSSGAILSGWMDSTEHRANVLNKNFSDVGFGIADSPDYQNSGPETIVVAMYAEPLAVATSAQPAAALPAQTDSQPAARQVARIQTLSGGNASWSLFVVATLGSIAFLWFALRHALAWKRVIVHSEEFIIHHRFLDILIVSVAALSFILTRTAGMIH